MPIPSPTRGLVRPALLLLLPLFSLACPQPPPDTTTPDLPQVSVVVDEPNTVGTSLKLSLSTSGCDQVQRLELLDNNELLKTVTYGGNPTPVVLEMSEIRYTRGIAANLSLTARVTCADGRTNISQAQPATFFPVAESIDAVSANEQVVPNYFIAEGKEANGGTVSFIGCAQEGANRQVLYKVTKNPSAPTKRLEMLIPCSESTVITERKNGWRWVWTPNQGIFAISANQFETGTSSTALRNVKADRLTITPEGNALVYDAGEGVDPATLRLITPAGTTRWVISSASASGATALSGFVIGDPVFTGAGPAYVPLGNDFGDDTPGGTVRVGVLNYINGFWSHIVTIDELSSTPGDLPPTVAFNASGTLLYMATQLSNTSAYVRACAISGMDTNSRCEPPTNLKWSSNDLTGYVVALVPYADGSRLAVVAARHTWFLNASTGAVVNKDGQSLSPSGALFPRQVVLGANGAFYLLTSGAPTDAQPTPWPVEIIATDMAERGELYRYQIPGGSIAGATDDSGALWLRVGRKLVKPLALEQYRKVR
ncbi:hypothetical protein [Archangium sp.]|jgi:hypothetical protein|uniref:hypothetical protein n=1 Tax=Archangium sp. TaxID=1872627 RepID=UPI002EDA3C86